MSPLATFQTRNKSLSYRVYRGINADTSIVGLGSLIDAAGGASTGGVTRHSCDTRVGKMEVISAVGDSRHPQIEGFTSTNHSMGDILELVCVSAPSNPPPKYDL